MKNSTRVCFWLLASLTLTTGVANAESGSEASATTIIAGEAASVPATGVQQLSFSTPTFARYALQVNSDQGSALQLIDRENGPGEWHGVAGENNGRLDTFLAAGEYRLRVKSSERGSGLARVRLQAFAELQPEALQLVELKPENTTLADFQQRSWWLELDEPRRIVIEAGGRHLQNLELWRDGRWRIPLTTEVEIVTPQPGQPLRRLSFSVQLEAGQYRLSAYGGTGETWTETSDAAPLYLRWGVPTLPAANRQQFVASPLGIDRYRVPDTADYFRLELPTSQPATLAVGDWREDSPFTEDSRESITKKSRLPVATLKLSSRTAFAEEDNAGSWLITVKAPAGQPYTLQNFTRSSHYQLSQSGDWWIDSIHTGAPEDSLDATALLVAVHPGRRLSRIKATTAVEVGPQQGWNRRFNLLQPAELFLQILEDGDYTFTQLTRKTAAEPSDAKRTNGSANLTLEPVYLNRPKGAPKPTDLEKHATETLSAGLYRLRLEPRSKGIVEVAIFAAGTIVPAETPVQGSNRFGAVELEPEWRHIVIPANQGDVDSGLILRRLPLDMSQPLSLSLAAGESLSLPLELPTEGLLTATDEYGNLPELSAGWLSKGVGELRQPGGNRKLTLSNKAERPAVISLSWHNPKQQADSPLPKAAAVAESSLPKLVSGTTQFIDLADSATQTFELQVKKPALYRLESTGLLATSGQLRTRATPYLASAESNGVGRNFLIQRYLRPGDYRLTVGTLGSSAGRLGVKLSTAPLISAGQLHTGIISRQLLPAGQGLDQRFEVTESGYYELQVLSQLPQLRYRLEDSDGWPVLRPGNDSPINLQLAAGNFRLIIEPGAVDGRVITRLAAKPKTPEFGGKGPHTVELNQSVKKRWMEPVTGEARIPDRWLFNVPAAATISINASNEMRGVLYRISAANRNNSNDERITDVLSPAGWRGELPAGNYRLELEHGRRSNRVDYQLQVNSVQLVPGQTRSIRAPATLALSLPAGLSRIASFGPADVRGRLYNSDGEMVASNDDASGDWNLLIAASLPAGTYRLAVEPVGSRRADTEISLQAPQSRLLPSQLLKPGQFFEQTLDLQDQYTMPLEISGREGQLLLVRADSGNTDLSNGDIGMSLEQCTANIDKTKPEQTCQPLANHSGQPAWLAIAPGAANQNRHYRLRLWSQSDQATSRPVRVRLLQTEPESVSEQQLVNGLALPDVRLTPGPVFSDDKMGWSAARLDFTTAGVFSGSTADLRFTVAERAESNALQTTALPGQFLAAKQTLVVGLSGARLQAYRQSLQPGKELSLPLREGDIVTLDTPAATSPTLLLAQAHNGQPGIAAAGSVSAAYTGHSKGVVAATVIDTNSSKHTAVRALKADGNGPLALHLRRIALAPAKALTADDQGRIVLPPRSAVTVALPAGRKTLQLALPRETAAVLNNEITLWSGSNSSSDTVQSEAEELRLYHAGSQPALFSLRQSVLTDSTATTSVLSTASPLWHTSLTNRSRLHVRVSNPNTESVGLEFDGNIQAASWSGDDGRYVDITAELPSKLELTGGGIISIDAKPGLLALWLNGDGIDVFGTGGAKRFNLPGTASVTDQQAFRFTTAKPQLLSVRGYAPVLLQLQSNGEKPNRMLHTNGARLDQYLPAGNHKLKVRLLGQQSIDSLTLTTRGVIEISNESPTAGQGESAVTQAEPLRLAAGDSVLYGFTIGSDRKVGIGIKASPDQAEAQLLDSAGRLIGGGSTQLQTLKAGRYMLRVTAPADGESLEITPTIIGLQPDRDGPPDEIRQNYIQQARAAVEGGR